MLKLPSRISLGMCFHSTFPNLDIFFNQRHSHCNATYLPSNLRYFSFPLNHSNPSSSICLIRLLWSSINLNNIFHTTTVINVANLLDIKMFFILGIKFPLSMQSIQYIVQSISISFRQSWRALCSLLTFVKFLYTHVTITKWTPQKRLPRHGIVVGNLFSDVLQYCLCVLEWRSKSPLSLLFF